MNDQMQDNAQDNSQVTQDDHNASTSFIGRGMFPGGGGESIPITGEKGTIEIPKKVEQPEIVEKAPVSPEVAKSLEQAPEPVETIAQDTDEEDDSKPVEEITEEPDDKIVNMTTKNPVGTPVAENATKLTKFADEDEDDFREKVIEVTANGNV